MKLGIMTDDDTWGYLQYAAEIREQGLFFKPHLFWYIGYALFILGANSLIPGFEGIVIFQYIFAYIALIAIYFTSINIFQNPKTALFTGICFLGFFMISFWNLFLYAESLLISLYCISFYFLSKAYRGNLKTYQKVIAILIAAWAILVKPTAVAFLAALLAVGLYKLFTKYTLSFRIYLPKGRFTSRREAEEASPAELQESVPQDCGKISSTHTQLTQSTNSTQSTQLTNSFSLHPSSFNTPSSLRPLPLSSPLRAPFSI
ncbi:glycosyltransferase family 39 protein [Belliella aquatica]|uniref:glycosyltransferase family 39 protein n=1 Tax=Belliella aquatica TaxID=1323734 RepID=UPI001E41ABB3|nr:glycosyltransferase family 39 protein [Belliella aquatica]